MGRNDKVRGRGEGVPVEYVLEANLKIEMRKGNLPANTVLCHFPISTRRPVPEIPRLDDILLEGSGDLPLVVIGSRRRRGEGTPWQHFPSVCENLGTPPLQLSVFRRRKSTDEGFSCKNS